MIRATELRIGNWIFCSGEEGNKITTVSPKDMANIDGEYTHSYSPILLTEEILLKCGFVKDPPDDSGLRIQFGNGELFWMGNGYFKYFHGYSPIMDYTDIIYLHTFQNLYFALEKKELTVNL